MGKISSPNCQPISAEIAVLPTAPSFFPLLMAKGTLQLISESLSNESYFSLAESDLLHFGNFWSLVRPFARDGLLDALIHARRSEIKELKEHWRGFIEMQAKPREYPLYETLESALKQGAISSIEEGYGGAYFLENQMRETLFVIKPVDEEILALNNPKYYGSPFNDIKYRVREGVPLYRSAFTDSLAYQIAALAGLSEITPKTFMAIIHEPHFYDINDALTEPERVQLSELCGTEDKEKLCSVQTFIPQSVELFELLHSWLDAKWSEQKILAAIDQEDFEQANIFCWLTGETDGHAGNYRAYQKRADVYGLRKIDNNLSFPEKNADFKNTLALLPNAEKELSLRAKETISKLPLAEMEMQIALYEMEGSLTAFKERIEVLQILSQREGLSIREIDVRLSLLEEPAGKELALSNESYEELENLFRGKE